MRAALVALLLGTVGTAPAAAAVRTPPAKPRCAASQQAVKQRRAVVRTKRVVTRSGRRRLVRVRSTKVAWACVRRPAPSVPRAPVTPAAPAPVGAPAPDAPPAAPSPAIPALPPTGAPATAPAPVVDDQGPGGAITITARDPDAQALPAWALTPSRTSMPRGTVLVDFVNWGGDPHNLWLRRAGGSAREVVGVVAGDHGTGPGVERATVQLTNGTYTLFCALGEHERLGMRTTLLVQ